MLYLALFCRFLKRDTFYKSSHSFSQFVSILSQSLSFFVVIHIALERKCYVVDVLTTTTNQVKYRILIKFFSVSSIRKRTVFVYISILLLPTATTQFAEILVRHVSVYMIIVYTFQIDTVLSGTGSTDLHYCV